MSSAVQNSRAGLAPPTSDAEQSQSERPQSPLQQPPSTQPSEDTVKSIHEPLGSDRRAASASTETTPIRLSDEHQSRSYNTTNQEQQQQTAPASTDNAASGPSSSSRPIESNAAETKLKGSKLKGIIERYGAITLENKGSVARDHLALERTFLAWLRTSLAFASIGIAVTQLFRLNTSLARNRSMSTRSAYQTQTTSSTVPFSPYIGHSIPVELLQYLQQNAVPPSSATDAPELGPTLLDQLLLLSASGTSAIPDYMSLEFDEGAAARLRHVGKPLGATFLGISVVVLLVGFHRYFEAQYWIMKGKFPASRGSIAFIAFIAGALIVTSLVVILVIAPTSYER